VSQLTIEKKSGLFASTAELEELIEGSRAFAANALLSTPADRGARRKRLKKAEKIVGLPPD